MEFTGTLSIESLRMRGCSTGVPPRRTLSLFGVAIFMPVSRFGVHLITPLT